MQFKAHQIILKIFFFISYSPFVKVSHTQPLVSVRGQCVVFGCMLCCLVGYMERRRALSVMPSQSLLVLVRQSVIQSVLSISVSYHSCSKVKWWTNFVFIETEITLFKRVELCQETIQSKKLIYKELFYPLLGSPARRIIRFVTISIFEYL